MMRAGGKVLIGTLVLWPMMVMASAPETSLYPRQRNNPVETVRSDIETTGDVVTRAAGIATLRPQLRPLAEPESAGTVHPENQLGTGPAMSLRPNRRSETLSQKIFFKKRRLRKGSVCGNINIQGKPAGNVPGRIKGCGIKDAVRVTSVSGVLLSQPALMTCETAQALDRWVERSVKPTFRRRGPVVELQVAAHYACRTRNNRKGARISEHGKGRAIDISAFKMMDGEVLTVLEGWKRGQSRRLLRQVWKGACGPFGTVLGPNSDGYHRDHFHLDTARYRSGTYCR